MLLLLCGCGKESSESIENTTTTTTSSTAQTTSVQFTETETRETDLPKKPEPLRASKKDTFLNTDEFSIILQTEALKSSLYYPDLINDYGANDKLFVLEAKIKVKNIGFESMDFDINKLSIGSGDDKLFVCDDPDEFRNIASGDTIRKDVRFLCSLNQISSADNVFYNEEPFEVGDELFDDRILSFVQTQSSYDVKEYLYRKFVVEDTRDENTFNLMYADPCFYSIVIKQIETDGKKYLAASMNCYNRSDYAQIIDPSMFVLMDFVPDDYGKGNSKAVNPKYISIDEKLIYDPKGTESIKGIKGKLYDIPSYICMNENNPTKFTLIYDITDTGEIYQMNFESKHLNEPWFNQIRDDANAPLEFIDPF